MVAERGGNTDQDGVDFGNLREVRGGVKALGCALSNLFRFDAVDIRPFDSAGLTLVESMSKPVTRKPASLKSSTRGSPT